MEGLCPCGHEPAGSIVPVSYLVSLLIQNVDSDIFNIILHISPCIKHDTLKYNINKMNTFMENLNLNNCSVS